jgi:hypothetical protein
MKRSIWILLLVLFGSLKGGVYAQTASFNFTATAVTVSNWTNVVGDPSTAVRTAVSHGITVSSVAVANWAPQSAVAANNGVGTGGGTFFPAQVMSNVWFQYNGTSRNLALYNAAMPQLTLSGLNKDSSYTLKMSGSDAYHSASITQYTVSGATVSSSQTLNMFHNTASGVTFSNIYPDASGTIRIYVNATSASDYAIISGLQVYPGTAPVGSPVVAITAPLDGTAVAEGATVAITATASESSGSISKVEFYADSTKIGEDDAAPYTFSWVDPAPGNYTVTAKATDAGGSISTAVVHINVKSQNYFWSTTGNIGAGGDTNFVGTVDTNRLAFRTNNIERMSILKDGTIGIGTKTTYGYALAVNGNAIFTKVRIKTAGTWPDDVFKRNYQLPTLAELEAYVTEHHHLPGIVSEAEANRDGVDVLDHQAGLLKQVEELTLYLIEENKRLKDHNIRLEEQQRQIDELKKLFQEKK